MSSERIYKIDYIFFILLILLSFMLGLFGIFIFTIIGMIYSIRFLIKYGFIMGEDNNVNRYCRGFR